MMHMNPSGCRLASLRLGYALRALPPLCEALSAEAQSANAQSAEAQNAQAQSASTAKPLPLDGALEALEVLGAGDGRNALRLMLRASRRGNAVEVGDATAKELR